MELLFKKHFWLVHLFALLLAALLVARIGNSFVEVALMPLPEGKPRVNQGRSMMAAAQQASLTIERLSKVTGLKLPDPEPTITEPTVPVVDLNAPPVRSSLRVKLLGTLLSGLPEWSIASIQDIATLKSQTYMTGDKITGAEILEIERQRVIVLNNNRREFIDSTPGSGEAVAVSPPVGPPQAMLAATAVKGDGAPPSVALGQGIKPISDNEYEVPRAEIDKTLSNLNDVAMQARIVPAFKDGVSQGFKLFSIRPDSIYTKIGIQNGDVIKRINGYDLNSPEKALEIYSKMKDASRIDIEVDRNGSTVRKTYTVR